EEVPALPDTLPRVLGGVVVGARADHRFKLSADCRWCRRPPGVPLRARALPAHLHGEVSEGGSDTPPNGWGSAARAAAGRGRRAASRRRDGGRGRLPEGGGVVIVLPADLRAAFRADVVVAVAGRQDEQELLPHGHRAAAARAEEAGGFELAV